MLADEVLFAGGRDGGVVAVEAEFGGDGAGGLLAVAGDHHHAEAEALQLADRGGRGGLDRVGEGEGAGGLIVDGDADEGVGGGDGGVGARDRDAVAVDRGANTDARFGGEVGGGGEGQFAPGRGGDDGAGEGMFAG